ncbi:FecR family protein [Roseivirga sp.]|uniref:FecR family protein n=1 Tax=Roseivirga sp. TaxID=1964215 RepID=UPI003B8D92BF
MSKQLENKEFIARWLSGDLSEEEKASVNETELQNLKTVLDDVDNWSLPKADTHESLKALKGQLVRPKPAAKVISFRPLLRYAATIALIAAAWFIYDTTISDGMVNLKTGLAATLAHELPDGSDITLGAVTEVNYSEESWNEARTLDLDGQAYFDVEKGATFTVETPLGNVKVLGTEFDVQNLDDLFAVNCFEGSVAVTFNDQREVLKPGEGLLYEGGALRKVEFNDASPTWTAGMSVYDAVSLVTVVEDLKRYYNVEIDLPTENADKVFDGSFSHGNLESALRSIFLTLEIDYTLSEDGKVIFE